MSRRNGSPPSLAFKNIPPGPRRISVIPTSIDAPVPRSVLETAKCPHGGYIVNAISYCGYCTEVGRDGPEGFAFFLEDLFNICRSEARGKLRNSSQARRTIFEPVKSTDGPLKSVTEEEYSSHAFVVVMRKLQDIFKAKNPQAKARVIARNAIRDIRRKAQDWAEWDFSELALDHNGESDTHEGEDWGHSTVPALTTGVEDYVGYSIGEHRNYDIPGGERLWVPTYQRRLITALEDAMDRLPKPPQHNVPAAVSLMIRMWAGALEGVDQLSYKEIAGIFDSEPHRVKRLIQQGIRAIRRYILAEAWKPIREQFAERELQTVATARDKN